MPDSIFDFASHKGSGSKPKPRLKPIAPASAPKTTTPEGLSKTVEALKEAYSKAMKQRDELDNRLGTVLNRTGVDFKTVRQILDNPITYQGVNAKSFQEQREKYRNDIWRKTGEEDKQKILAAQAAEEENRLKTKGIGARKKNWTFIR